MTFWFDDLLNEKQSNKGSIFAISNNDKIQDIAASVAKQIGSELIVADLGLIQSSDNHYLVIGDKSAPSLLALSYLSVQYDIPIIPNISELRTDTQYNFIASTIVYDIQKLELSLKNPPYLIQIS